MTTTSSTKVPSASTSTPARPSTSISPEKIQVRRRLRPFTAVRLRQPQLADLPWGARMQGRTGDWLITDGTQIVDLVPAKRLDEEYETLTDALQIPRTLCGQIEGITGVGTTQSAASLLAAIDRLAHLEIGTVKIAFTPGQLAEIAHRASKRGWSVQQELQRVVDRIKDELFYKS